VKLYHLFILRGFGTHLPACQVIYSGANSPVRISHRLSTAASDTGMFTALRSVGLLDILSNMSAGPKEPVRGLKGIAFRAPSHMLCSWWGRMQGAAPQAMSLCIVEARQRSRWPRAAGTLWAHGVAGNLYVARRRRCALASTSSSRLELAAQAPCARPLLIHGPAP